MNWPNALYWLCVLVMVIGFGRFTLAVLTVTAFRSVLPSKVQLALAAGAVSYAELLPFRFLVVGVATLIVFLNL